MTQELDDFLAEIRTAFSIERLEDPDSPNVSAIRIVQSVLTALERGDVDTLRRWERPTIRYMEHYKRRAYLDLLLPLRKGIDRHITLRAIRDKIQSLLEQQENPPSRGKDSPAKVGFRIAFLVVQFCRPLPFSVDFMNISTQIGERYAEYDKTYRKIDPEWILIDALELFGVPRQTVHNWMKGLGSR